MAKCGKIITSAGHTESHPHCLSLSLHDRSSTYLLGTLPFCCCLSMQYLNYPRDVLQYIATQSQCKKMYGYFDDITEYA